jgi:hypothetical protein
MSKDALPARLFRCRIEELGPVNDMVKAMFTANQADFGKASPDYLDKSYLKGWDEATETFTDLVPTGVRRATDKEVTKAMNTLSKSLRDPLNWLEIRLGRAEKKKALANTVKDFGLAKVRTEISTRDMEGLDGVLNTLLLLLALPANAEALAAQGHTATDTKAFKDARQQIFDFNTEQNSNLNSSLELTAENVQAGNDLWAYTGDVLNTGFLMYKESQPQKAKTFTMAGLLKRLRKEGGGVKPEQPAV